MCDLFDVTEQPRPYLRTRDTLVAQNLVSVSAKTGTKPGTPAIDHVRLQGHAQVSEIHCALAPR